MLKGLTKQNTLFLSLAAQFNDSLAVEIVPWFGRLGVVYGLDVGILKDITIRYISDRQDLIDDVTKLIKKLDLSIDNLNLEIESRKISLDSLPQDLPDVVRNIISHSSGEIKSATIKTYHPKYDSTGKMIELEIWLFVTLYAKSTDKMPRQHTSNPKIPKVSKAIASPFY